MASVPAPENSETHQKTVAELTQDCHLNLIELKRSTSALNRRADLNLVNGVQQVEEKEILELYERFAQWAGNLGALQPSIDHRSLDYRLSESPVIRGIICKSLAELSETTQTVCSIVNGTRINRTGSRKLTLNEGESLADYGISDESEYSDSCPSEDEWNKYEDGNSGGETSELREYTSAIGLLLDKLFSLAVFIRKFSADDRREKAAKTLPFDSRYDVMHIQKRYERMQLGLAKRLGEANARRRQYFKYRKDHDIRLKQRAELLLPSHLMPKREGKRREPTPSMPGDASTVSRPSSSYPSEIGSTTLTAETEVTALLLQHQESQWVPVSRTESVVSVVSSVATSVVNLMDHDTQFPPIPSEAQAGRAFICPYCYVIIEGMDSRDDEKQARSWKKHVLRDLEPYVCTFQSCGLDTFHSQYAWFDHELSEHRSQWICKFCSEPPFHSSASFGSHLALYHDGYHRLASNTTDNEREVTGDSWRSMRAPNTKNVSFEPGTSEARPLQHLEHEKVDPDQKLNRFSAALLDKYKRPVNEIDAKECPFCLDSRWAIPDDPTPNPEIKEEKNATIGETSILVSIDDFRKHVGQHLQKVALFSLPRQQEGDDANSEAQNMSGMGNADLDRLEAPYYEGWGRADCGRGWRILSEKRATFVAITAFIRLLRPLPGGEILPPGSAIEEIDDQDIGTAGEFIENAATSGDAPDSKQEPDRSLFDIPNLWGQTNRGRGWALVARKWGTFTAISCFLQVLENVRTAGTSRRRHREHQSNYQVQNPPQRNVKISFQDRDRTLSIGYITPSIENATFRVRMLYQTLPANYHLRTLHLHTMILLGGMANSRAMLRRSFRYSMHFVKLDPDIEALLQERDFEKVKDDPDIKALLQEHIASRDPIDIRASNTYSENTEMRSREGAHSTESHLLQARKQHADAIIRKLGKKGIADDELSFYLTLDDINGQGSNNGLTFEKDTVIVLLYNARITERLIEPNLNLQIKFAHWQSAREALNALPNLNPEAADLSFDRLLGSHFGDRQLKKLEREQPRTLSDLFWCCCLPMVGSTVAPDHFKSQFFRLLEWVYIERPDDNFWHERVENLEILFLELYMALDEWSTIRVQVDGELTEFARHGQFDNAKATILGYLVDTGVRGRYKELLERISFFVGCILLLRDGRPPSVDERLRRYL